MNPHNIGCLNVKGLLARSWHHIWSLSDSNVIQNHNYLVRKQPFSQADQMIVLCCEYLSVRRIWLYVTIMSRTSFRVNPHSMVCLNVKERFSSSRRHIWSLSDSSKIRTHNHLVCKRTINHLAKLAKWLSCVVSTYLCGAFDCMLSCHVRVSEWIHTV